MPQNKRLDIMESFSRGIYKVLVTTDVASRGLDLLSVTHVMNFDLPKQAEEYVHRIGRTGRAGFKGTAISFVGPKDWDSYVAIKNYLDEPLRFEEVPVLLVNSKDLSKNRSRVKIALQSLRQSKQVNLRKSR